MNAWRIVRYELRRGLVKPGFWLLYALFTLLGFVAVQAFAGVFDGFRLVISLGGETLWVNSPFFLSTAIGLLTALGAPLTAAYFAAAVHRDVGDRSAPLLWTTPIGKWSYWAGRGASALLLNLALLTGVVVGLWLGTEMPWIDPDLLGADQPSFYAQPFALTAVRRTLLAGAAVTLAVVLTRSTVAGYLAVVALIGAGTAARRLTADLDDRRFAALVDPTGSVAAGLVRRTWSTAERNTQLLPVDGVVAANLALWTGIAVAVWLLAGVLFRPERQAFPPQTGWVRRGVDTLRRANRRLLAPADALLARLPLGVRLAIRGYRIVVTHPMFAVTVLFGLAALAAAAPSVAMRFGTPTWPVTYSVLEVTAAVFEPFAVGVTIFFAGHLLWRDRDLGLKPIVDASPHGPALPVLTTFFAMSGVLVTLQALLGAAGVVYQRMNGHTRHEWGTYALDLFVLRFADLLLVLVLSLFVQLLLRRKAIAYLATAAVYLGVRFSPALGLDHVLYRYGHDPGYQFSEVNGVGGFLWGWAVVQGYWTAVAALMLVAGVLLWPRGVDADVAARKRTARRRLTRRTASVSAAAATVALGLGAITVYNVHGLNDYRTPARAEALQVRVEQEMGDWRDRPHPRITDARYAVDLFPRERRADVRGELRLVNPHGEAIETLLLRLPRGFELLELTVDGRAAAEPVELADRYRRLDLGTPLAARAGLDVVYRGRWHERGFGNRHSQGGVLDNGSFIGAALVLGFGYDDGDELQDPQRRRRFGLPARDPLPALDAPGVRGRSLRGDADWTRLEISVTTDADQVALAPGDLVDTRTADDRTTYTYRTATPVQHLWAVVSGSYEVTAERWRGVDLEVYHRPEHDHNVDSMVRGMKRSLEYLTATFGDYPHGALRIVEFPRYATFAMSLPGLIPFSEGIGFIARKRSADDIDYPFYVTAHEVAHLWFPHRASPAHAEGMAFLSETFAQYVALRVMEEQFGPELIGKYLRYELDRYLIGRGVSRFDERSLHTVHHQQHIYYNKGSLAIYRAAELIGRDVMDAALLEYLERFDLDGPPYPTSSDFLEILRRHAAPEHHGTLADLFERITFYDVAVGEASCEALGDARYRVTLDVRASKTYADGVGRETPATLDEPFDVGVFAERRVLLKKKPKTLELERRRFTGDAQVVFEVDQLPLRAGVDPFYTLVDRKPEDNVVDLDCGS